MACQLSIEPGLPRLNLSLTVKPIYPASARGTGVHGVVIVEITIGIDGRVTNTRILRSIPLLDHAAVEAVKQWEFEPTLSAGVPVPVVLSLPINFPMP
jgi:protein TonB